MVHQKQCVKNRQASAKSCVCVCGGGVGGGGGGGGAGVCRISGEGERWGIVPFQIVLLQLDCCWAVARGR